MRENLSAGSFWPKPLCIHRCHCRSRGKQGNSFCSIFAASNRVGWRPEHLFKLWESYLKNQSDPNCIMHPATQLQGFDDGSMEEHVSEPTVRVTSGAWHIHVWKRHVSSRCKDTTAGTLHVAGLGFVLTEFIDELCKRDIFFIDFQSSIPILAPSLREWRFSITIT